MKRISLSADAHLIARARARARSENRTLNAAFGEWLARYAGARFGAVDLERFWQRTSGVEAGRRFTREEMNAR